MKSQVGQGLLQLVGSVTPAILFQVSETSQRSAPLRMAVCGSCKAKNWISSELRPLEPDACNKCWNPVIVPFRIRQFELREIIASGGMVTVYRSHDVTLERDVAVK